MDFCLNRYLETNTREMRYGTTQQDFCDFFIKLKMPSYIFRVAFEVVRIGFEPMTYGLENRCSIQLSYRTINSLISFIGMQK